jgi:flagellar biosynthetic protein FliR
MGASIAEFGSGAALGAFVLFCRIGCCLMIAPGVSNAQIPVQVRLFVAIAVTLALSPLLMGQAPLKHIGDDPLAMLKLIVMEGLIGAMIGGLGRAFFSALESLATVTGHLLGFTAPFGIELDAGQASSPISTVVMLSATAFLFAADFHWEIIRGLVASYDAIPIKVDFDAAYAVRHLGAVLGQSFLVAVRVTSPFFLYSVIANFALSLINRVTPQIQVFFVGPPFVIAGGLTLFYFVVKGELNQFMDAFGSWLTWG